MHFSLLEKLGAAALICAWLLFGVNFLGNSLVHVEEHVSQLPGAEAPEGGAAKASAEPAKPQADFATLLASADAGAGEKIFAKCKACHAIDPAGGNKVGPNLHNVVGRPVGSHEGFSYSEVLKGKGGEWSYDHLNHFLENPKAYAPGTKMSFAGLSKAEDRAEVIAYLRANTESPPPLPEPTAKAEEPAPAAAAEEKAPPAEEKGAGEPAPGKQAAQLKARRARLQPPRRRVARVLPRRAPRGLTR